VIFTEQPIPGAFKLELEPATDERGFFARIYAKEEFSEHGISFDVAQASVSYNELKGTLRGLHLQVSPHEEAKLVRCTAGTVFDVLVDLRQASSAQFKWLGFELAASRRDALFVPPGVAHGFITLEDACELEYLISTPYVETAAVGVRWDDPAIGISWPEEPVVISARDASFADVDVNELRATGPNGLRGSGA
jgi:dTDP-4-dehydrorhamnose 3,5-epimerase